MEMAETLEQLKYPLGKFISPGSIEKVSIPVEISIIASLPVRLREATGMLDDKQLDTPYRPNGWTVRQVVHHLGDSHVNSYCRFRLALSEENPVIKPYLEDKWANLTDARSAPIFYSLNLLDAIHGRWVLLLNAMTQDDFKKTFFHPEHRKSISLFEALSLYSWHCNHHLAHITGLKVRMGW